MNPRKADEILDAISGQFEPPDPVASPPESCDCGAPAVRRTRTAVMMECGSRYWYENGEWTKDMSCRSDRKAGTLDMSTEAVEGWVESPLTPEGYVALPDGKNCLGEWKKDNMVIQMSAEYWWGSGNGHGGGEDSLVMAMRRASYWQEKQGVKP